MGRAFGSKNKPRNEPTSSGRPFAELMTKIDTATFLRMLTKSGLPAAEQREIAVAFRDLKE